MTACRRILVIEDDPTDELLTLKALRSASSSADIVVARDGHEAMRALKLGSELGTLPDLVLLDLKLPRMDGYEVLERIRASPEMATVPVVVFSSSDEPEDVERCEELGASDYARKAIDYNEFSSTLNRIARRWLLL